MTKKELTTEALKKRGWSDRLIKTILGGVSSLGVYRHKKKHLDESGTVTPGSWGIKKILLLTRRLRLQRGRQESHG